MRYERDDSGSRACAIISDRIRSLSVFVAARSAVIACALGKTGAEPSVDQLRALGGLTEILRREVLLLGAEYRVDHGSKMYPRTVVDELLASLPQLREQLQRTLARVANKHDAGKVQP